MIPDRPFLSSGKRSPQRPSAARKPPRILLADDDDEMLALLTWVLQREGYEVTACADGLGLMEHVAPTVLGQRLEDYDLVISDIRMTWVTGLEALRGMHGRQGTPPPIILITAFGDNKTHAEGRRLGAVAMLDKPFEIDDLLAMIRDIVAL